METPTELQWQNVRKLLPCTPSCKRHTTALVTVVPRVKLGFFQVPLQTKFSTESFKLRRASRCEALSQASPSFSRGAEQIRTLAKDEAIQVRGVPNQWLRVEALDGTCVCVRA